LPNNTTLTSGKNISLLQLSTSLLAATLLGVYPLSPAPATDAFTLTLKEHQFAPTELQVPANERFRIEVENRDLTPAEFESTDLHVEKIVVGGGKIIVSVGPLRPGTYRFFDDYNPDTTKGTIVATDRGVH
jgi:hypothetical protein